MRFECWKLQILMLRSLMYKNQYLFETSETEAEYRLWSLQWALIKKKGNTYAEVKQIIY